MSVSTVVQSESSTHLRPCGSKEQKMTVLTAWCLLKNNLRVETQAVTLRLSLSEAVCFSSVPVKHLLSLVVSERDALRRHFEVDHGGGRWRVHGDGLRGGLLNRLVTRQRLQRHRTKVPHITRCTGATNTQTVWLTDHAAEDKKDNNLGSCYCAILVLISYRDPEGTWWGKA